MHGLEYVMMKVFIATKSPSLRRSAKMWISASRAHCDKGRGPFAKMAHFLSNLRRPIKWDTFEGLWETIGRVPFG